MWYWLIHMYLSWTRKICIWCIIFMIESFLPHLFSNWVFGLCEQRSDFMVNDISLFWSPRSLCSTESKKTNQNQNDVTFKIHCNWLQCAFETWQFLSKKFKCYLKTTHLQNSALKIQKKCHYKCKYEWLCMQDYHIIFLEFLLHKSILYISI